MFKDKTILLKTYFALAALESAAALFALAAIPADAKNALLLGFSASRLILMGGAALVLLAALRGWIFATRVRSLADAFLRDALKCRALSLVSGTILAAGIIFALTPAARIGESVYQRVQPLVILAALIALQTLVVQFIYRGERLYWERMKNARVVLTAAGVALAGFIAVWIFVAWSQVGITPQPSGWLTPGTPILAQQVLFAWLLGVAFLAFEKRFPQSHKTDVVIALLIWGIAGAVWYFEPMTRWGYFTPKPTPPNFEYYPHSDAALYDQYAQNILIGTGRQVGVFIRPLYAFFLAALHLVAGQKYLDVVAAQTVIMAIIPALIYLVAARLGGRPAGIAAATLALLREKNSIALTNLIEVSHSKVLMSELPTLALLLLFILFLLYWLADKKNRLYFGALSGACFGLALMIRSQIQFLIPVILVGIALLKRDGWKPILQRALVFMLGLLLVVVPWVWRNYQVSGQASVEYPGSFARNFALTYFNSDAQMQLDQLPDETQEAYSARIKGLIIKEIFSHPFKIFGKYFSYFIHNEVLTVTYLPMTLRFHDLYRYLDNVPFWSAPAAPLPAWTLPVFFMTLCLIALGIGGAYQRLGWLGAFAPLAFHFLYSFSVTLIYISGWRFILPVDWVSLAYLSVGLMQLSALVLSLFSAAGAGEVPPALEPALPPAWGKMPLTLTLLAAVGISIPLFEFSFPERYPALETSALIRKYIPDALALPAGGTISAAEVEAFAQTEPGAVVAYGRALYPAYYKIGTLWGDAPYLVEAQKYDRLEFRLIGAQRLPVFIPMETAPAYFPHASDVFVVGCATPDYIRALAILVDGKPVAASPWNGLTCDEQ